MALTKATYSMISGAVVNVFDFMTPAEIANVQNRVDGGDLQPAIQAAFDYVTLSGSGGKGMSVFFPAGRYYISSTVSIPNGTVMFGEGRNQTGFRPRSGFTGVMFTDKGNASKVVLRDFRIDGMGEAGVTDLIKMGYGAEPLGGGEWNNLFLYSGEVGSPASHIKAINAVTNVFSFTEIEAGFSGTDFYLGSNSGVTFFTRCLSIASVDYGFYGNGSLSINNCEIEAPAASCIGVYASRETVIQDLTYAQAASTTNPFAIEIDASCSMFTLNGFINTQGAGAVLTNLLKDNRSNTPTYWGDRSTTIKNMPLLANDVTLSSGVIWIQNQKRQSFKFRLVNTGGTLQHRISTVSSGTVDPVLADKITGATATLTNTPTGADASTAFAAGAKISSANTSIVIFNTETQTNDYWTCLPIITANSSGTALTVTPTISTSVDVNGVTRYYMILQFLDATSGANYDLLSLPSGKAVDVVVETYLA